MGDETVTWLREPIGGFASRALRVSELLPRARFPEQIEIRAGKHFVRPRYEIARKNGRIRIAHPNVERSDLKLDEQLPKLAPVLGKGFILPAPVLPLERFPQRRPADAHVDCADPSTDKIAGLRRRRAARRGTQFRTARAQ